MIPIEILLLLRDALAGVLIATLSGLGVGGGGLLVVYLTALCGMEQITAQGVNLLAFLCMAAGAIPMYARNHSLNLKTLLLLAVPGAVFAIVGSSLATLVSVDSIRKCFGWLLIASSVMVVLKKSR